MKAQPRRHVLELKGRDLNDAPGEGPRLSLDKGRCAVVTIGLQNDLLHDDGRFASELPGRPLPQMAQSAQLMSQVNAGLKAARRAQVPVIHCRWAYHPDYRDLPDNIRLLARVGEVGALKEKSWGAALVEGLAQEDTDRSVRCTRMSAFAGTELDALLQKLDVTGVLFMGVTTDGFIEGTARHAADLGYDSMIVTDACISSSQRAHDEALSVRGGLLTVLSTPVRVDDFMEALQRW